MCVIFHSQVHDKNRSSCKEKQHSEYATPPEVAAWEYAHCCALKQTHSKPKEAECDHRINCVHSAEQILKHMEAVSREHTDLIWLVQSSPKFATQRCWCVRPLGFQHSCCLPPNHRLLWPICLLGQWSIDRWHSGVRFPAVEEYSLQTITRGSFKTPSPKRTCTKNGSFSTRFWCQHMRQW